MVSHMLFKLKWSSEESVVDCIVSSVYRVAEDNVYSLSYDELTAAKEEEDCICMSHEKEMNSDVREAHMPIKLTRASCEECGIGPGLSSVDISSMKSGLKSMWTCKQIDDMISKHPRDVPLFLNSHQSAFSVQDALALKCAKEMITDTHVNNYLMLLQLLNDQVVKERGAPACLFYNSFFWNLLFADHKSYSYDRVKKWRVSDADRFRSYELIFFPINISDMHWACSVIDTRQKVVWYLDSLGCHNLNTCKTLLRWYAEYMRTVLSVDVGVDTWRCVSPPAMLPKQQDGVSCGVFMLMYAHSICLGGLKVDSWQWDQSCIPAFRYNMLWCLLCQECAAPL